MPANSLLITSSNIHQLTPADYLSFSSKEYWHKFILKNGGLFDKEAILQTILNLVAPFDLIPVKYTIDGDDAFFLARNCKQAIERLCLTLLSPQANEAPKEISLSIQICSTPIEEYKMNMQFHLKRAIEKRYDENHKGYINLSAFHKDPELYDVLFCPLSKPKILAYVLSILKRIFMITSINLSNNDIEILKPLEVLNEFKELAFLDLSKNKISDLSVADFLGRIAPNLQEISLRGNPVCTAFKTQTEYIKWVREKNLKIKKLDGLLINYGLPNHQVFMCSEKPLFIINEFLKYYFILYDNKRQSLEQIYENNAIFSMTCNHHHSENSVTSRLECYKYNSKYLVKSKSANKIMGVPHLKNTNIINVLLKLPKTEHDPFSFKVDVLLYQEGLIVLMVSGIFKDFQEIPRYRSFNRTFVIKKISHDQYKIMNDMYHVTNATQNEINGSFLHSESEEKKKLFESLLAKNDQLNLIEFISTLTEMSFDYSKRCLEDTDWDIKRALEVFLENYQACKIPSEAFNNN